MDKAWRDSSWCVMSLVTPMLLARTTRVEHVHGEKKSLEDLITQLKAVFRYLQTNWYAFGKKIAIHYK